MRDKKLLRLLACFDEQELKRLKLLVDSPYFNNEESARVLLEYLLPYAPDFKHPKINYDDTFQHLFGSRPLQSDPKLAVGRIMHKLVQLVREFIAQETLSQQPVQKSIYQIQFLQRHSMVEHIPKLLEEADELLEANPYRNEYYFRQRLLLESEGSTYLPVP